MHRLYHRYQKRTSKFHAHDEENACKPSATWCEIVATPAAVEDQALAGRRDR